MLLLLVHLFDPPGAWAAFGHPCRGIAAVYLFAVQYAVQKQLSPALSSPSPAPPSPKLIGAVFLVKKVFHVRGAAAGGVPFWRVTGPHRQFENMSGNAGITKLLQAEEEAAQIVKHARECKGSVRGF